MSSNNNHLRLTIQSAPPPANDYQSQPKLVIASPSSTVNCINQPKLTIQGPYLPSNSSKNCDATTCRGRVNIQGVPPPPNPLYVPLTNRYDLLESL